MQFMQSSMWRARLCRLAGAVVSRPRVVAACETGRTRKAQRERPMNTCAKNFAITTCLAAGVLFLPFQAHGQSRVFKVLYSQESPSVANRAVGGWESYDSITTNIWTGDQFTLSTTLSICNVSWWGFSPEAQDLGNITSFTIQIGDLKNFAEFGPFLVEATSPLESGMTSDGSVEFRHFVELPGSFQVTAGKTYWIVIVAQLADENEPIWRWTQTTPGTGSTIVSLDRGATWLNRVFSFRPNAAFALTYLCDADFDGWPDTDDNCPSIGTQSQSDLDGDGVGDVCDVCPADALDECNIDGSVASEIQADTGATVETPDGNLAIEVEPGDLTEDTTISVTETIPTDPEADLIVGTNPGLGQSLSVYDLAPDGASFASPVTITVKADVTGLNANQRTRLSLYLFDDQQNKFVEVPTTECTIVNGPPDIATCTAELDHFSTYALIAPLDTDGDGVADLFPPEEDLCPTIAASLDAALGYTGDLLVPIGETGSASVTASALLTTTNGPDPLAGVPLLFDVANSAEPPAIGTCSAITDVNGVASCSLELPPDVYTVTIISNELGCPASLDEALLVVFDPDVPRATGGGFILPDGESTLPAASPRDKANFGFIVRIDNNQAAAGNLEFQYKSADINLKSLDMTWYTVSNNKAMFQGEATINGAGFFTFRVHATDGDLAGGQPDRFDIRIWSGTNTEGDIFHRAKNDLAGGSIVVHRR